MENYSRKIEKRLLRTQHRESKILPHPVEDCGLTFGNDTYIIKATLIMRKCCQKYTGKRGEQSMEHITSRQNALMTHIRKLSASRAYRRASGEYLCDGVKLLEEALRWNAPLKTVVLSEGVDAPTLPSGVRAVQVPADVMRSISPMETPQGALFTVRLPDTALPETLSGAHYLVLDGVQDPGNVGTILRTADAFDCDGVFLVNACADPYSSKTARATMGAVFRRDVYQCTADELCALLQKCGLPLYGTALRNDTVSLRDAELSRAAVAIGSEGRGLSAEILSKCEKTIKIPMSPRCESLNAAVAASVVLWEMYR